MYYCCKLAATPVVIIIMIKQNNILSALSLIFSLRLTVVMKIHYDTSFRFCSKRKFLLYNVALVGEHTVTSDLKLPNACAVRASLREELIHAKETVEDRWSVRAITSGILWVSSAGELVVRVQIDSECILTCWHLSLGCKIQ